MVEEKAGQVWRDLKGPGHLSSSAVMAPTLTPGLNHTDHLQFLERANLSLASTLLLELRSQLKCHFLYEAFSTSPARCG